MLILIFDMGNIINSHRKNGYKQVHTFPHDFSANCSNNHQSSGTYYVNDFTNRE